jgi:molybdate transport system substrate-binding protein
MKQRCSNYEGPKADTVRLYAAGSLRAALTVVARAFEEKQPSARIELEFGASGLLRERIEKGELAHVFASADVGHPAKLTADGVTAGEVVVFARNELCALVRAGLKVTTTTLLDVMLDPMVRVGTSTPKADPSGDYAFALFAKAETIKPGAKAILEGKVLQLTGGPTSSKAPAGINQYAWVMSGGKADLFLTYCTNAVLAERELPGLKIVHIPPELSIVAEYGLVVLENAPTAAMEFARFILSAEGESILTSYGFGRGDWRR